MHLFSHIKVLAAMLAQLSNIVEISAPSLFVPLPLRFVLCVHGGAWLSNMTTFQLQEGETPPHFHGIIQNLNECFIQFHWPELSCSLKEMQRSLGNAVLLWVTTGFSKIQVYITMRRKGKLHLGVN
jgi:hypothetical protein